MKVASTVGAFGQIIANIVRLIAHCGYLVPLALYSRRKGVSKFEGQLLEDGLDAESARYLAQAYKDLGNVSNWVKHKS